MRCNSNTHIIGNKVSLVPYRRCHVLKYHEWMQDPWLQEMTASEPLSLEEEYDMQRSWREDEKKCTFIILDNMLDGSKTFDLEAMAGDVNLFLNDYDDAHNCEIDIMIARAESRGKGLAYEAVELLMAYAVKILGIKRFYCKISETNLPSQKLFASLGYLQCNYVEAFKEFEFEQRISEERSKQLLDIFAQAKVEECEEEVSATRSS